VPQVNKVVPFSGEFDMENLTILVSDIADLVRIGIRHKRGTPARSENLHGRLLLLAGQPGRPSKIRRVRANRSYATPDKIAAALHRLVPSIDGDGSVKGLVLPMGDGRVVAADVATGRGYLGELEHFDEEVAVGDLLADPGLFFLEWLHYWSEWAPRGHLQDTVLATTLKALHAVGRAERWRDTDFRVTGRELDR
jgi:hypothetical protein